jgi:hypothetical protein
VKRDTKNYTESLSPVGSYKRVIVIGIIVIFSILFLSIYVSLFTNFETITVVTFLAPFLVATFLICIIVGARIHGSVFHMKYYKFDVKLLEF